MTNQHPTSPLIFVCIFWRERGVQGGSGGGGGGGGGG